MSSARPPARAREDGTERGVREGSAVNDRDGGDVTGWHPAIRRPSHEQHLALEQIRHKPVLIVDIEPVDAEGGGDGAATAVRLRVSLR